MFFFVCRRRRRRRRWRLTTARHHCPTTLCFRTKTPEEGTLAIKHCLFAAAPAESGHYLGSDAIRSPLHYMRNPGEPAYDGVVPF